MLGSRHSLMVVCGRIALYEDPEHIARLVQAGVSQDAMDLWRPTWNLAPQDPMLGVSERRGERMVDIYKWGLVPSWTKDPMAVRSTFNARAETLATKSMFRRAFQTQRILVPVDAFYEWKTLGPKRKQPYAFRRADGQPIVFAGLREWWRDAEGNELRTATIITTEAGPDMPIHDRQPVVLEPNAWDQWLDRRITDPTVLELLLVPTEKGTLIHHPVNRNVGNVKNNGPELIDVVAPEEEPVQTSLQLLGVDVDS